MNELFLVFFVLWIHGFKKYLIFQFIGLLIDTQASESLQIGSYILLALP